MEFNQKRGVLRAYQFELLWGNLPRGRLFSDIKACAYILCVQYHRPCSAVNTTVVFGVRDAGGGGWEGWATDHHSAVLLRHAAYHGGRYT